MIKMNRYGAFVIDSLKFVPYRHHSATAMWLVKVIDKEEVIEFNVFSEFSQEAVMCACRSYKKYLRELQKLESMRVLEAEEKFRKEAEQAMLINKPVTSVS